jgi:hypothetical protein
MDSKNTAPDKPALTPLTDTDGNTAYLRIKEMRREFSDFWIEVYPYEGVHGLVQIMGIEYFNLDQVKAQFMGQLGFELPFRTYDQWNTFMDKLVKIYNQSKEKP